MTEDSQPHGSTLSRRRLLHLTGAAAFLSACTYPESPGPKANPSATMAPPLQPTIAAQQPVTGLAPAAPTPTAISVSGTELCRDSWGARPPRPGGRPHTITRMTIHHTAVVLGDNSNIVSRLQQHQRYHQDEKGWVDIAYHVGVDRNGNIFELRTPAIAGDTATNYDPTGHFLVVCEGNFDEEPVSEEQLDGAALAFAWAIQEFGITSNTLASHQEVTPTTACPGANLQARVASGDLKRRIDDFVSAGAIDLQVLCGPGAAAQVAAIQAGR
jgi:hypothetical protein